MGTPDGEQNLALLRKGFVDYAGNLAFRNGMDGGGLWRVCICN
jgi:hypothetical protein